MVVAAFPRALIPPAVGIRASSVSLMRRVLLGSATAISFRVSGIAIAADRAVPVTRRHRLRRLSVGRDLAFGAISAACLGADRNTRLPRYWRCRPEGQDAFWARGYE